MPFSKSSKKFKKRQPILLKSGLYGAVLSSHREPQEQADRYNPGEMVTTTQVNFLVGYKINEKPLPQITTAAKWVKDNFYYDEKGVRPSSNSFLLISSLNRKLLPVKVWKHKNIDEITELNQYVGHSIMLKIEPSSKATAEGIVYNNVVDMMPVDDSLAEAMQEWIDTFVYAEDENTGSTYIKSPVPEYEDDDETPAAKSASKSKVLEPDEDDEFGEVPF